MSRLMWSFLNKRRRWIRGLAGLLLMLGSAACARQPAEPEAAGGASPTASAAPARAALATPEVMAATETERVPRPFPSATATETARQAETTAPSTPGPLPATATSAAFADPPPIRPLADQAVVDQPRAAQALTDGSRPYRLAAWGPNVPYVALVPQDGPGMDIVDVRSGEVSTVVSDTYVLEPVWTDDGRLLLHQTADGQDTIRLYDPEQGLGDDVLAAGPPLAAVGYGGGTLAFARPGELVVCSGGCGRGERVLGRQAALVTAPGPVGASQRWVAWVPETDDLEQVVTYVTPITPTDPGRPSRPLSTAGEGLWLPRWSPDGTRIALTSIEGRLVVAAVDGSARYDLGPGDSPAWSPDGSWIAFAGASAGLDFTTRDIHLVRPDGRDGRIRLTDANSEQIYVSPSWSPDGRRLAFVEIDSGQLFVVDVDP
jgi:hypothetical protein